MTSRGGVNCIDLVECDHHNLAVRAQVRHGLKSGSGDTGGVECHVYTVTVRYVGNAISEVL